MKRAGLKFSDKFGIERLFRTILYIKRTEQLHSFKRFKYIISKIICDYEWKFLLKFNLLRV